MWPAVKSNTQQTTCSQYLTDLMRWALGFGYLALSTSLLLWGRVGRVDPL